MERVACIHPVITHRIATEICSLHFEERFWHGWQYSIPCGVEVTISEPDGSRKDGTEYTREGISVMQARGEVIGAGQFLRAEAGRSSVNALALDASPNSEGPNAGGVTGRRDGHL